VEIILTWVVVKDKDKEVATTQIWEATKDKIWVAMLVVQEEGKIEALEALEVLETIQEACNNNHNKWARILRAELLQIKMLGLEAIPYLEIHCLEKNDRSNSIIALQFNNC